MSDWGPFGLAVLGVFAFCTTVTLVAINKDWDPGDIRLYRRDPRTGRLNRRSVRWELRYGGLVRGLVWPVFYVAICIGAIFGIPLYLAWSAIRAVARWVLEPRWEPVVALALLGGVLWLLSRCGN